MQWQPSSGVEILYCKQKVRNHWLKVNHCHSRTSICSISSAVCFVVIDGNENQIMKTCENLGLIYKWHGYYCTWQYINNTITSSYVDYVFKKHDVRTYSLLKSINIYLCIYSVPEAINRLESPCWIPTTILHWCPKTQRLKKQGIIDTIENEWIFLFWTVIQNCMNVKMLFIISAKIRRSWCRKVNLGVR